MSDHVGDANVEAYEIMAEILVTVRRIVHRGLEKAAGKTWYLDGCPPGVYERLVARKENEVAIDRFDREYQELISFASLDDLAEIIEFNDELAHLLEGIAPEGATIVERFRQIEALRLKLAATVQFDDEDLEKLIGYHADFRKSLAKPKKKAKSTNGPEAKPDATDEAQATEIPAEGETEPTDDFGTRVAEVDELGAEDVVPDNESEDFGTAVVDSGVIAAPEAPGVDVGSALEVERAMVSEDDGEVLRILHREIMSVAEHVLKGDVNQEFPVWQTLKESGWYDIKSGPLALAPVELFYTIADEIRAKLRAGVAKDEIRSFVDESRVSKLLLSLSEMFKRQEL